MESTLNNEEFVVVNDEQEPIYLLPSNSTILATNISMKATESSLREFFGICGVIKKVSLNSVQEGEKQTQTAIIQFENDEAAKTAIFLNDTFIIDSAIKVVPYNGEVGDNSNQQQQPLEQPPVQQTNQKPGVFVNMLASAYMFGAKAWQKAVEFDKQHQISATIQEKAKQVDNSLGISNKSKVVSDKLGQVADNIDKSLKITENTNKLATKSNETLNNLKHRNEKTEKFFQNLDNLGKKITHSWEEAVKIAEQKIQLVRAEIKKREEEDKINMEDVDNNSSSIIGNNNNNEPNETSSLLKNTDEPVQENLYPNIENLENNNNQNYNSN